MENHTKNFRALIVGDNTNFRRLLRYNLEQHPFIFSEEKADADRGMEEIHAFVPVILFLDIRLPGGSILSLPERIKRDYPKIVVIALARRDLSECRQAAIPKGVDYFLTKRASTYNEVVELVKLILTNLML
jgi:two-component system response regulator MprA/two-component system response regulator PrrA